MIYTVTLNPTVDCAMTVERFSVGGTFRALRSDHLPAGKGINVARVVATLGEPVVALGLVGEQDRAAFAAALSEAGIENRLLPIPGVTRASVTILDPVTRTETHLREQGTPPPTGALDRVAAALDGVGAGDWVVLSGSLPPGMPDDAYRVLIECCARAGACTLLDANGPSLLAALDARPTVLKPNLFELWQVDTGRVDGASERDLSDLPLPDVLDSANRIHKRGIERVVVSLGARGVLGLDADGRAYRAHVQLEEPVVDTVGCGDALAAGLVVSLARGEAISQVLRLGVACGAANALVPGAGCCRETDIRRLASQAVATELSSG